MLHMPLLLETGSQTWRSCSFKCTITSLYTPARLAGIAGHSMIGKWDNIHSGAMRFDISDGYVNLNARVFISIKFII